MNNERLQILQMVQEGKVSPEAAAKLLDAVEQPRQQPKQVRLLVAEGTRKQTLVLNLGLVQWLLQLPGFQVTAGGLDRQTLAEAIAQGSLGRVLEAEEGTKRLEIWLDA